MRKWLYLSGAIVTEVAATLSLRASTDEPAWLIVVVCGYIAAFGFLALTLRAGAALGTAYGTWSACGVALVALLGIAIFGERLTPVQLAGIALLIIGVVVVETGAGHSDDAQADDGRALAAAATASIEIIPVADPDSVLADSPEGLGGTDAPDAPSRDGGGRS